MAKDPAFLFYPGDWMGGTQWMTMEQKGCYMELLILQFNTGGFNIKQAQHVLGLLFEEVWQTLKSKFETDGTIFWNSRLKIESERRKEYTDSRRKNRSSSKKKQNLSNKNIDHMKNISKTYDQHMENENENENIIKNEVEDILKKVLQKIQLKQNQSREFHNLVYRYLVDEFNLIVDYEVEVESGRVDLVINYKNEKVGIELDNRIPRAKSILKLETNYKIYFLLVRDPKPNYDYRVFKNCLLYENGFLEHPSQEIVNVYPMPVEILGEWNRWKKYKKDEFGDKYKKLESEQIAFNKLVRLSEANPESATKIINQSIENHYRGLFELGKTKSHNDKSGSGNSGEKTGRISNDDHAKFVNRPILIVK